MAQARVEVWNNSNTTKVADCWAVDPDGFQRNFDAVDETGEKLGDPGSGAIVVQVDHPVTEHAVPGRVLRLVADDGDTSTPVMALRIRERDRTIVSVRHVDETVKLTGDGLLTDWSFVEVDPWIPGRPISPDRVWNFASPRGFNDSTWSLTNHIQTRVVAPSWPEAYPVAPGYANMLWTLPTSASQPVGSTLWRRTVTVASDVDAAVYASADDAVNIWCDGVLLNRHSIVYPDTSGWQKTWREVPPLSAGTHVFAFEAFNYGGAAYFMSSIATVVNGVFGTVLASTGDDLWRWLGYPTPKPGFTAAQIVTMLLDEAHDRNHLLGWSLNIHGSYPQIEEFSVRIGTDYLTVLDQLAVDQADFAADVDGLVLHMWPKGGRDRAPAVTVTPAMVDHLSVVDTDDVVTAVQVVWSDGVEWVVRTPHPVFGRREASLQLGAVTDVEAARRIANAYLDAHSDPTVSIVGEFHDTNTATAGVDYQVGDTVGFDVGGLVDPVRCSGLTWTVDAAGELVPVPEFDSMVSARRRELLRTVDRLTAGFDSPATAPILASSPLLVSGYPRVESQSWSWSGDIDELNDPDKPAQVWSPSTVQRLWKVEVEIDPDDLPDAWGTSTIRLLKNGTVINALYDISLTTVIAKAEAWIWAYEVVTPADRLQIQATVQGGHVDGRVTVHTAEAV